MASGRSPASGVQSFLPTACAQKGAMVGQTYRSFCWGGGLNWTITKPKPRIGFVGRSID